MEISQIMTLVNAGFTKSDILALTTPAADPTTAAEPTPTADPTAVADPTPVQAPADHTGVTMSEDQFTRMMQTLQAGAARADLPPNVDVSDMLAGRLNTMLGEVSKK